MKRWLALFLSLLFIVPTAVLPGLVSAASQEDCIIAEIPLTFNATKEVPEGGYIGDPNLKFDPIDLSKYKYDDLALVLDLYLGGDPDLFLKNLDGSLELTSGGNCDIEEINWNPASFPWKQNEWFRLTLKLNTASSGSSEAFDPSSVNYMRLYAYPKGAVGETFTLKMCNVRLVDTSKGLPTDRIGDGTFTPEPPTWQIAPTKYDTDDTVVMGYNLGDYMEPNTDEDATTTIQSLLEGLNRAGGGTLFIPEGEYTVRGNLTIPQGVTICGDWRAPTEDSPKVVGTILKAYAGREDPNGTAFITMLPNSMVRDLSIWYPEQDPEHIVAYPTSIQMYKKGHWGADYTHVRNVTFVNSYEAVRQGPDGSGCPNVHNVYGTPLGMGLQMDGIYDVGRFDYVYFGPKYWEKSGLPGSPTTDAAKAALKGQLESAVAVNIQRVDWSYFAYMEITGYGVGVYFTDSEASPNSYSNGQCYGMTIRDCGVGILFEGISSAGELFANIMIENCTVGISDNYNEGIPAGNMDFSHITINATDVAVQHDGVNRMMFANCTITGGQVITTRGPLVMTNCTFQTDGPQILLESGSTGTIVRGCTADGGLEIDNSAMCLLERNDDKLEVDEVDFLTAEQAKDRETKPARETLYVAEVDDSGKTDVTAALQALLDKAGKEGGGIVFLPGGEYRLEGSLTVPTGVELKGAVDIGRIPYNIGTIFKIYNTKGDASVQLKEGAGIVGIVFDYPEQGMSVDTIKAYPYAVQGQGKDVYVVNVSIRNGYDGVDLMTYRCDNHYVRYLAGYCFHNVIKVGKGAVGGMIANYQMNCGAWYNGGEDKYGAWPNSPKESDGTMESANLVNNLYVQQNCDILIVGDVTDQILYDNFNYLGHRGALFIEENGKSASGWNVGNAYDYSTVGIEIQALTDMDFVNVQIVSYNYMEEFGTDLIHHIYVADTYKGDGLNVFNLACWARPTSFLRVDAGKLNIYNSNYDSQSSTNAFVTMGKEAVLNLQNGALYSNGVQKVSSNENLKNVTIAGFFYEQELSGQADCNWLNNLRRITRWSKPDNAQFDPGSSLIFTENFTGYETKPENGISDVLSGGSFSQKTEAGGNSNVTLSQKDDQDVARLFINEKGNYVSMQSRDMNMKAGQKDSFYKLESRLQIASVQPGEYTLATLLLYGVGTANGYAALPVVAFTQYDGVTVNDVHLADWKAGTWYRVTVEVDLRNINNKTFRVSLYDDNYKLIASSKTMAFSDSYQGNSDGVGYLKYEVSADTAEKAATTEMLVDYVFISRTDPSAAKQGDINGDGKVDTTDARLALQYAVGKISLSSSQLTAGDVNGDSKVDTTDARLILQFAVGKIASFPKA